MSLRERPHVSEAPVEFMLEDFDPKVAQKFLPDWEFSQDEGIVFLQSEEVDEGDIRTRRMEIDLGDRSVMILESKNHDEDPISILCLVEVNKIKMHSRFGSSFITFLSEEGFLVFRPHSMDISTGHGEPVGHTLLR